MSDRFLHLENIIISRINNDAIEDDVFDNNLNQYSGIKEIKGTFALSFIQACNDETKACKGLSTRDSVMVFSGDEIFDIVSDSENDVINNSNDIKSFLLIEVFFVDEEHTSQLFYKFLTIEDIRRGSQNLQVEGSEISLMDTLTSNKDVNRLLSFLIRKKPMEKVQMNHLSTFRRTMARDVDNIHLSFSMSCQNFSESLALTIELLHQLPTGTVLKLWSEKLYPVSRDEKGISGMKNSINYFVKRLVRSNFEFAQILREHEIERFDLTAARDTWKDTAIKIQCGWAKEKSELFNNFLTLYQAKQNQCRQNFAKMQQLEIEVQDLKSQLENSSNRVNRKQVGRRNGAEANNDVPDDLNVDEVYDPELVARLAAGISSNTGKCPDSNLQKRKRSAVSSKKTTPVVEMKRLNTTTGAIEYYDTTALFEDEALFKSQSVDIIDCTGPTVTKVSVCRHPKKSQWNNRDAKAETEKLHNETKKNDWKKRALSHLGDDSSSTTEEGIYDDDDDSADVALKDDILAQLELLKKK